MIDWFNNPLIKWDMVTSKVRYSRRIIFDLADAMGKFDYYFFWDNITFIFVFLVSTGGIAALFFGASFVTVVEISFLIVRTTFSGLGLNQSTQWK